MFRIIILFILNAVPLCLSSVRRMNYSSIIVRHTHEDYEGERDMTGQVINIEKRGGIVVYRLYSEYKVLHYLLLQSIHSGVTFNPPNAVFKPGLRQLDAALLALQEETGIKKSDVEVIPDFQIITKFEHNGKPQRNVFFVAELLNANQTLFLTKEYRKESWCWYDEAILVSSYLNQTELYKACDDYFIKHQIIPITNRDSYSGPLDFNW